MCRFGWILSGILALAVGILLYQFVIRGSVVASPDERTAVVLTEAERDLVLSEMRGFLVAVQGILSGAVNDDLESVAEHARAVGMASQNGVPTRLIGKLPLAFKRLGFSTHEGFDRLASEVVQVQDARLVQPAVAELLQKCVACHASYRLLAEGS